MVGLGTIINVFAIIVGGVVGLLFGKKMKTGYQNTLMVSVGVCTMFIGIAGAMEKMLSVNGGALVSGGTMMIIGSIAAGALIGEILDIEGAMERFGRWLKMKTKSEKDSNFINAFVTASLTVCIGAMAVVGAINDGIAGDYSILATKAILDFIIIFIMTASMGKGCIFSALPVAAFQGSITALARVLQPLMTEKAMSNLSLTGSILIFCVGINLVWGKKVKVANLLPSLIIAVAWAFV